MVYRVWIRALIEPAEEMNFDWPVFFSDLGIDAQGSERLQWLRGTAVLQGHGTYQSFDQNLEPRCYEVLRPTGPRCHAREATSTACRQFAASRNTVSVPWG